MIPKLAKDRRIHRLRIINLYKANYNLCIGVLWRKLLRKMEKDGNLHDDQHGSRPGHSAAVLPLVEELLYDSARYTRTLLVNFDNDAIACYDRIIPRVSGMTAKSYGQSNEAVYINNITLKTANYFLKMGKETTEYSYQNSDEYKLYGTGQGSANSPVIWATVSLSLFRAMEDLAFGASLETPDGTRHTRATIFGYVDDSSERVNDFKDTLEVPVSRLVEKMRHDAQTWSDILWFSGGKLKLSKCLYHVMTHQYNRESKARVNVVPQYKQIKVQDQQTEEWIAIPYKTPYMSHKTLSHYKAPVGDLSDQQKDRMKKGMIAANTIASCKFTPGQTQQLYWSVVVPTVRFTLSQSYKIRATLQKDQQAITRKILHHMGINRNTHKSIIYGSRNMGGLGMLDWYHLQGEGQIMNFLSLWRAPSHAGKILKITSLWAQQHAGISEYFLNTQKDLSYLPTGWFKSLAGYLRENKAGIRVDKSQVYPKQCENNFHIMDRVIESGQYSKADIKMINNCRLHLRVTTISDISNMAGTHINPAARTGNYIFLDSVATGHHIWTRQPGKQS